MYKKLVILFLLLILVFIISFAQFSSAVEIKSHESKVVTGFYGDYIFQKNTVTDNNLETKKNELYTSDKLPQTGDSNEKKVSVLGILLVLSINVFYCRGIKFSNYIKISRKWRIDT